MHHRLLRSIALAALLAACGGGSESPGNNVLIDSDGRDNTSLNASPNNTTSGTTNTNGGFVPEVEEFVVRAVASTDRFVFVPNSADGGTTVARINGVDLSVTPIPVGLNPTEVVAFLTPNDESIAAVLVEGTDTLAIIRADANAEHPVDLVHLMRVPNEVNALIASSDGRHVLAYIDPRRPLPAGTSVASLQAAALIRVGQTRDDDAVFELSLTRLIRDVEVVDEGRQIYVVGQEGVNRLVLDEIVANTFIPPLGLQISNDVFPPGDLEVEVAGDASFLVVRSSAYAGLSLHSLTNDADPVVVALPGIPTDIDLFSDRGSRFVLATIRDASELVIIDVDDALANPDTAVPEAIPVAGASAGLAQLTPDLQSALLYSTLPLLPSLAVLELETRTLRTYALRSAIRSVALSPDSKTAVVVHDVREEAVTNFQRHEGLTIFDVPSGYRRPITLEAHPVETVMATLDDNESFVFVLLDSPLPERQGVLRVDLRSFRTDFVPLARAPKQIGLVAGKLFIAQDADEGRITFIDVETLQQRTVSGYELNAGID